MAHNRPELVEPVEHLSSLLSAFAQETAIARREAVRLRSQNATLKRRVRELESRLEATSAAERG